MPAKILRVSAIIAIALLLAYIGAAATPPMHNYAPVPASLYTVIVATLCCSVLLALATDQAVQSIVAATALALFLFGGIRAGVIAWSLTHQDIPFTLYELAISDSVFQYTLHRGLFMYMVSGLLGMLGAVLAMIAIPDRFRA